MVDLFGKGFVCIITAIVCWIIDNTMCSTLRSLPLGLPYPCVRPTHVHKIHTHAHTPHHHCTTTTTTPAPPGAGGACARL